jgi:hypothetical protein
MHRKEKENRSGTHTAGPLQNPAALVVPARTEGNNSRDPLVRHDSKELVCLRNISAVINATCRVGVVARCLS